jgi:putative membrane protein
MFPKTKVMAANQGLYNGFLAAGLLWSVLITSPLWAHHIAVFFLACVVVAGIYGAFSVSKSVFFKQALPALIVFAIVLIIG